MSWLSVPSLNYQIIYIINFKNYLFQNPEEPQPVPQQEINVLFPNTPSSQESG